MTLPRYVIAVDLGGTNLRTAAIREDGVIEGRIQDDSDARSGSRSVLVHVLNNIRKVEASVTQRGGKILGAALGFPGIVNPKTGIVHQSPHFPDWKNLDLFGFFKELPWPVIVDNDANMAALGEGWLGAARGVKNFLMLTFGTGVGGGIILDGKILHGERGFAGEVGHIVIQSEGPRCACGNRGCLEMYVSAVGIKKLIETSDDADGRAKLLERFGAGIDRLTIQNIHEAALDGDIFANVTFKKMGYYLGVGLTSLVNTLGVETIVLGGGVSRAWDFFIEPVRKEFDARSYREVAKNIRILKSALGDDAGLTGCAASFLSRETAAK